jgi:hypothetical protein
MREPILALNPAQRVTHPLREQADVENISSIFRLLRREQIKKETGKPAINEFLGDENISRAQPGGTAAMSE